MVLEIGSGGGRWTQYLLGAREVIAVELNPEFFPYLAERFPEAGARLRFYQTSGYELDGVPDRSVDFVFSFGTFVHIEPEGIALYLRSIARVLRPGGAAVIHYGDTSKPFFRSAASELVEGFAPMDGPSMEALATASGLTVQAHDKMLLNHSNLITLINPAPHANP
ncbi:MAG TPA: class I SAM-dependent methyltransferase [Longimicrobiaceae bacterium]